MIDYQVLAKTNKKYSNARAALMIKCAEFSYDIFGRGATESNFRSIGFPNIKFFENLETDTQAYVVYNEIDIIIVFRGSSCKKDWQTNFSYDQLPTDFGSIHKGFFIACNSIKFNIEDYIKSIPEYTKKTIYVTGHSLGSALASIFCLITFLDIESGWAFGSPRWAGRDARGNFNQKLKNKFFRIVYNNDLVCRVPPCKIPYIKLKKGYKILTYEHVDKLIYITANGHIRSKFPKILIPFDRLWGRIRNIGEIFKSKSTLRWFDGIDDHMPHLTFNALAKACGNADRMAIRPEYDRELKK